MRNDILKYLGTVMESTAKTISECIGFDRLDVSRELNAMTTDGILERRLKPGKGSGEYVYWISRADASSGVASGAAEDGVEMHPKSLPASATAFPKDASTPVEKPEVADTIHSEIEAGLRRQITSLEDHASVLQLKLETSTRDLAGARQEISDLQNEIELLTSTNKELREKCAALQLQINEHDERRCFETWFKSRPESKSSTDTTSLKEKMWESWFERSKVVEESF